jgi:hypothetical protein
MHTYIYCIYTHMRAHSYTHRVISRLTHRSWSCRRRMTAQISKPDNTCIVLCEALQTNSKRTGTCFVLRFDVLSVSQIVWMQIFVSQFRASRLCHTMFPHSTESKQGKQRAYNGGGCGWMWGGGTLIANRTLGSYLCGHLLLRGTLPLGRHVMSPAATCAQLYGYWCASPNSLIHVVCFLLSSAC